MWTVEMRGVCKHYQLDQITVPALQDVALTIRPAGPFNASSRLLKQCQ
jgi:putative ABC transport system ATP-binding protein